MLDYTDPIRVDTVPIDLKETCNKKFLLENNSKVKSKDDHSQLTTSV